MKNVLYRHLVDTFLRSSVHFLKANHSWASLGCTQGLKGPIHF